MYGSCSHWSPSILAYKNWDLFLNVFSGGCRINLNLQISQIEFHINILIQNGKYPCQALELLGKRKNQFSSFIVPGLYFHWSKVMLICVLKELKPFISRSENVFRTILNSSLAGLMYSESYCLCMPGKAGSCINSFYGLDDSGTGTWEKLSGKQSALRRNVQEHGLTFRPYLQFQRKCQLHPPVQLVMDLNALQTHCLLMRGSAVQIMCRLNMYGHPIDLLRVPSISMENFCFRRFSTCSARFSFRLRGSKDVQERRSKVLAFQLQFYQFSVY